MGNHGGNAGGSDYLEGKGETYAAGQVKFAAWLQESQNSPHQSNCSGIVVSSESEKS